MARILIVDGDPGTNRILAEALRQDKHEVQETLTMGDAQRCLASNTYDAVVAGEMMLYGDGRAVVAAVHDADPTLSLILVTARSESATESMGHEVFDFLAIPLQREAIRAATWRACERTCLLRENEQLRAAVLRLQDRGEAQGESRPLTLPNGSALAQLVAGLAGERFDLTAILEQTEKELILRTLTTTGGAQAEAARRMGLSRSALAYKLNKYGIRAVAD